MMTRTSGIGRRVAEERHLAGWTQARLAQEAHVSVSLVRAVEQERAPASPAFVSAVARALKVGVADLLDQPYPRATRDEHNVHAGVPEIRRELAAYGIEPEESAPRDFTELAAEVDTVSKLRHSVQLGELGAKLPPLLADLRLA